MSKHILFVDVDEQVLVVIVTVARGKNEFQKMIYVPYPSLCRRGHQKFWQKMYNWVRWRSNERLRMLIVKGNDRLQLVIETAILGMNGIQDEMACVKVVVACQTTTEQLPSLSG
jgi:hypothetical protein